MIKAVIFDLGNVLVGFDRAKILERLGAAIGCGAEEFRRRYELADIEDRLERGRISPEALLGWFRSQGFDGSFSEFRTLWSDNFHELKPVSRVFTALKGEARVLILSNTNKLHYEFLSEKFPFLRQADKAVLSYELGLRKPEAEIYRAALKAAGDILPEEAVFIDDLMANIEAASALGINTILLDKPEDLKTRLYSFLEREPVGL